MKCQKIANTQLEDLFQVEPDLENDIDYKLSNFNTSKINFLVLTAVLMRSLNFLSLGSLPTRNGLRR